MIHSPTFFARMGGGATLKECLRVFGWGGGWRAGRSSSVQERLAIIRDCTTRTQDVFPSASISKDPEIAFSVLVL
jgi:hypothetical protein